MKPKVLVNSKGFFRNLGPFYHTRTRFTMLYVGPFRTLEQAWRFDPYAH